MKKYYISLNKVKTYGFSGILTKSIYHGIELARVVQT